MRVYDIELHGFATRFYHLLLSFIINCYIFFPIWNDLDLLVIIHHWQQWLFLYWLQAYEDSLADDLGEEFRLPITHRPVENLNTEFLEQASVHTSLSSSNIGFRLLQKMGWRGKGLGKNEQGVSHKPVSCLFSFVALLGSQL